MKIRALLLSVALLMGLWGCGPDPIRTELVGYRIQFPITMMELQKAYPNGSLFGHHNFIDSTASIRTEWQFDSWGGAGRQDRRNQPYGVVIFLKNKGNQLDSLKMALEGQYKQSLKPLAIQKLEGDFTRIDPPIYVCHINRETILALTKAVSYRGDRWSEYNSLRISIGYNLSKKEEELFALTSGDIHEDTD
ncbi:hypothetical protein [Spirosoma areae]